jgi:hypothetical protein
MVPKPKCRFQPVFVWQLEQCLNVTPSLPSHSSGGFIGSGAAELRHETVTFAVDR